jgi:prepilin-type N-terminal cleavage/methylation domain-containing protein
MDRYWMRGSSHGYTIIELMIAMAVFSIVALMLLSLSLSMGIAMRYQDAKITSQDDARTGMMILERELRQAATSSIPWGTLPSNTINYRVAVDNDNNGYAVDMNNDLELGPVITIGIDNGDLNGDGLTTSQLIRTDGATVRVLANGLMTTTEDGNANNILDAGEDINGNGILDQGVLFESMSGGVRITIQTQRPADRAGTNVTSLFHEFVVPRN